MNPVRTKRCGAGGWSRGLLIGFGWLGGLQAAEPGAMGPLTATSVTAATNEGAGASPGTLRVMTFNIRYAEQRDGDNRWDNRREAVMALIAAEADVAGLQEVLAGQRAELRRDLPDFEEVGRGRERAPEDGEACPILYRRARFERVAAGTFWLSETPAEAGSRHWGNTLPRICTWVELRERDGGRRLTVFNLHLDHESAEARSKGAALVKLRAEAAASGGAAGAVIVLGDFNEPPDGPAVEEFIGTDGWRDAWRERGTGDGGTFNGWRAEGPYRRIDYVFYRRDGLVARSARTPQPRVAEGGGWASDHFPVIAGFDWR